MKKTTDEPRPLTVKEFAALGGKARAKSLTKKARKEIAANAAEARWGKKVGKKKAGKQ